MSTMGYWEGLLILLLLSTSVFVNGKRYEIHQPWTLDLRSVPITSTSANTPFDYIILNNGSAPIVSDNGTFALALLVNKSTFSFSMSFGVNGSYPTLYSYGVVMQKKESTSPTQLNAIPVWTTTSTKDFFSSDLISSIEVIEMNENGNLALYDNNQTIIWESFDHPRDILLPRQRLKPGMRLHSKSQFFDEHYIGEVADSGFVLYVAENFFSPESLSHHSLAYGLWILSASPEVDNVISSAQLTLCQGHEAVLEFTGSELGLSYVLQSTTPMAATTCNIPPLSLPLKTLKSDSLMTLPYVQLTSQGDLVFYNYETIHGAWVPIAKISDSLGRCKLPTACASNVFGLDTKLVTVCDMNNHSQCTISQGKYHERFHKRFGGGWYSGYALDGVDHFSRKYMMAESNLRKCEEDADQAIYDNKAKRCYMIKSYYQRFYKDNKSHNLTAIYNIDAPFIYAMLEYFLVYFLTFHVMHLVIVWVIALPGVIIWITMRKRLITLKYGVIGYMNSFNKTVQEMETLLSAVPNLPCRYTYVELRIATEGFISKLGAGGFGSVYHGVTTDGKHIAVKRLADCGKQVTKQFITEIAGIGGINHVNIVKLYGFCVVGTKQRLLVYEYMPNGSLDRWIFRKDTCLSWQQRLDICRGTAKALHYLHEECSEPILHLDVKPQNILLDEKFVPKLGDFGVAKLFPNRDMTHATTTVRGTFAYMAPEWLMQTAATKKCDVYSFGLVLLEIIGGRKNTDWLRLSEGSKDDDVSWYFPSWVVKQIRLKNVLEIWDERVRPSAAENEKLATLIVHLALWCIQNNPSLRPSFTEIVEIFEGHRTVGEPPLSFQFNDSPLLSEEASTSASASANEIVEIS